MRWFPLVLLALFFLIGGCGNQYDVTENIGVHAPDGGDAALARLVPLISENPNAKTFSVSWDDPSDHANNLVYDKTAGTLILRSRSLDLLTFTGVQDFKLQSLVRSNESIGELADMGCTMKTYKEMHPEQFPPH